MNIIFTIFCILRKSACEQDAQQQAGLPQRIDDLGRPVGLCVLIGEFMLAIPAHEAHQADPCHKEIGRAHV